VEVFGGKKTYGHEASVVESIFRFVQSGDVDIAVKDASWLANTGSSRILLASGSSNLATQEVIGTPRNPIHSPKVGDSRVSLPYSIGLGCGTFERLQYGKPEVRTPHCIQRASGNERLQPDVDAGKQMSDYLLVTRIPGPSEGTVYTVLAGLHGPGTRSAELLFGSVSPKDLEKLASMIDHKSGKVPSYQAIFRASKFQVVDGSDVPSQLELVTERFPPIRIKA
jgi:hypothetical protein